MFGGVCGAFETKPSLDTRSKTPKDAIEAPK
jgi:hypothetical protein